MLFGFCITIVLVIGFAVVNGLKKNKKKKNFSWGVSVGLIMGTLVGGSSTIGTAQLAYNYGMTAWWFTIGNALGCLLLGAVFVKPFRNQNTHTLIGMIRNEYGDKVASTASVLNLAGMFINLSAQQIAASAVILVLFSSLGSIAAVLTAALFMVLYIVFGGSKEAGVLGIIKTVLLYLTMLFCGIIVLKRCSGINGFVSMVNSIKMLNPDGTASGVNLWNFLGRGFGTDVGSAISSVLGVISTQIYVQSILMVRSDKEGRKAAFISAGLIPIIGIFGILVGLYMRGIADPYLAATNSAFLAKTALTSFIMDYSGMPSVLGGAMLGVLFLTITGTGSGVALGMATVINRDIINKDKEITDENKYDNTNKVIITALMASAAVVTCVLPSDVIQDYTFLSLALRACTIFVPLCFMFWVKKKVSSRWVTLSIAFGCIVALIYGLLKIWGIITLPVAAIFPGIIANLIFMIIGLFKTTL